MRLDRRLWYTRGVWALGILLSAWAVCGPGFHLVSESQLRSTEFHEDEAFHLALSGFFDLYVLDRDWHDERWFDEVIGPDQPRVGYYLLGWGLHVAGVDRPPNKLYDYGLTLDYNFAQGRIPSDRALLAGRKMMACFGAATVALLALMGMAAGRPLTGAVAAWLLCANELLVVFVTRAMMDAPLLAFSAAAVLLLMLGFRLVGVGSRRRIAVGMVVLAGAGICSGLATATKMNGLVSLALAVAVIALIPAQGRLKRWSRRLGCCAGAIALTVVSAFATFYWTNPYLCSYPEGRPELRLGLVGGMRNLFDARASTVVVQQAANPRDAIGPGLVNHARMVGARAFGLKTVKGGSHMTHATLANLTGVRIDAPLCLGGMVVLWVSTVRAYRRCREVSPSLLLVLWVLMSGAAMTYWIPLDWDRYYLPIIVPAQLMIASVLAAPLEWWIMGAPTLATAKETDAD